MWFTETPWPPIFLCGVAAIACVIAWSRRQQGIYLIAVVGLALLSLGIWFVERSIVTERERVEIAVRTLTTAFQQRDLDRTLSQVSKQSPDVRALVAFGYNLVEIGDDMRVSDVRVEMIAGGSRAVSQFRVNGTLTARAGGYSQHQPTRWEARWQLEANEWRMIDIQELDPITGETLDRLTRYRNIAPRIPG